MSEPKDWLMRRQSIIEGFKTPHNFANRIMQLEDECRAIRAEYERREDKEDKGECQFPKHVDKFGFVTHRQYLGEMGGMVLERCVVCGTVKAFPPIEMASA